MKCKSGLVAGGAVGVVWMLLAALRRGLTRRYGRPARRPAHAAQVPPDAVDVTIDSPNGSALRGWLRRPPDAAGDDEPRAAALVIHGWGGSSTDLLPLSEPLLAAGLHVLLLDARAHGRSDDVGLCSMPGFAEDIRTALTWLRRQPTIDPTRIILVGHSVGAGACLFVASEDPEIAGVVSLASMAAPREFMADLLSRHLPDPLTGLALRYVEHLIGHRFAEFSPVHTIGRIAAPVLLIHGDLDATVQPGDARRLHALAPGTSTLIMLPDTGHTSLEALQEVQPALRRFLHAAGVLVPSTGTSDVDHHVPGQ